MAVRAGRSIRIPHVQCLSMNALVKDFSGLGMAFRAGFHNVPSAHPGGGIARLFQIVGSVAVAAGGRRPVARGKRNPMHALFVARNKSGGNADLFYDFGVVQMTSQA